MYVSLSSSTVPSRYNAQDHSINIYDIDTSLPDSSSFTSNKQIPTRVQLLFSGIKIGEGSPDEFFPLLLLSNMMYLSNPKSDSLRHGGRTYIGDLVR